jgi:tetratricopeptide (TPR) repeat protein
MKAMNRAHAAYQNPLNPFPHRYRSTIRLCMSLLGLPLLSLLFFSSVSNATTLRSNTVLVAKAANGSSAETPGDWDSLLKSAEAAEASNDNLQALNLYNQLLLLRPHSASIWNRHGLTAMRLQDYGTAVRSLSEAVRDHPINGAYYESLAWALLAGGDFAGASEQSRTAILMFQRENRFSLYPFFIRYFAEHAQAQPEQAALSLRYAKRNLRDRTWPLPVLEYLSDQLPKNQLLASVSSLREETEAHLIIGLREYFIGDAEQGRQHLSWAAGVGDPRASGQAIAHAFRFNGGMEHQLGRLF